MLNIAVAAELRYAIIATGRRHLRHLPATRLEGYAVLMLLFSYGHADISLTLMLLIAYHSRHAAISFRQHDITYIDIAITPLRAWLLMADISAPLSSDAVTPLRRYDDSSPLRILPHCC